MITVIVLYDDGDCDHYVSARQGRVSPEKRKEIATGMRAAINDEPGSHEDGRRTISFIEIMPDDTTLYEIWS